MPDGRGVPGMQPSLAGNAVVAGDAARLARVVLHGPASTLPVDRPRYAVQMPPFATALNDADAAAVLTFVRRSFGNHASALTPRQVATARPRRGRARRGRTPPICAIVLDPAAGAP